MGFWHIPYFEFHEDAGWDRVWKEIPPRCECGCCEATFSSADELLRHRFEAHPRRRPTIFLQGRELGAHRVRITRAVAASDIRVDGAEGALLNGHDLEVSSVPGRLAAITSDTVRLVLVGEGVTAEFELEFRLATPQDLEGVESQFRKMAKGRVLDIRAVDEFIASASGFRSAIGYTDGLCAYLYGVLAKERAPDSSLPYEAYVLRFNKAAEELGVYNRPLANTISSLVSFHFNQFREASLRSPGSRVGSVARRFAAWVQLQSEAEGAWEGRELRGRSLEPLVTDRETESIIRWGAHALADLEGLAPEVEALLETRVAQYDAAKLHVLLGEVYAASGATDLALRHARELRNSPQLGCWADSLFRRLGEKG